MTARNWYLAKEVTKTVGKEIAKASITYRTEAIYTIRFISRNRITYASYPSLLRFDDGLFMLAIIIGGKPYSKVASEMKAVALHNHPCL